MTFIGGEAGTWKVTRMDAVTGPALAQVPRLEVRSGDAAAPGALWRLRGFASNERYVTRAEKDRLAAGSPALSRPEATRAALIPVK